MVHITTILARVPVIKFRKGGKARPQGAAAPATAPAAAPAASSLSCQLGKGAVTAAVPAAAPPVPDIDLPIQYQRTPPTQEEIDHINGGGIA